MSWQILLKAHHFPHSHTSWVELLTGNSASIKGFILTGKTLLPKNPKYSESFRSVLRNYETANNFISGLQDELDRLYPDMDWREENEKKQLMIDNYNTIREAFEEDIGEYKEGATKEGGRIGGIIGGEYRVELLALFKEAAEELNKDEEVDWGELEEELVSAFPGDRVRTFDKFRGELGDGINRIIAKNLPEGFPKLSSMYAKYTDVEESINYTVADITPELVITFFTNIQEPAKLGGKTVASKKPRGWKKIKGKRKGVEKQSTRPFKIKELRTLQTKGGNRNNFTETFKGILTHDLNDVELGLAQKLTTDMESKAVNISAVKERIIDAAFKINQGSATKEEMERMLGFALPHEIIPATKYGYEEFKEKMLERFETPEGEIASNNMVSNFKQKLYNYRKGVPKLFKDFIIHILKNKNKYKDILDDMWKGGYTDFVSSAPQDNSVGFTTNGTMVTKTGETVPIWSLPRSGEVYDKRVKMIHNHIIKDIKQDTDSSETVQDAWDALDWAYLEFIDEEDNQQWQEQEMFGDLLLASKQDEPELAQQFSDPFKKSIAFMFDDVVDDRAKLSELQRKHTPSKTKTINILDLIKEIRHIEIKLFGRSKLNDMLDDNGKYDNALKQGVSIEEKKKLVELFYTEFDTIISSIRKKVIEILESHLQNMINNQGKYLQYNDTIFNLLHARGLIRKV